MALRARCLLRGRRAARGRRHRRQDAGRHRAARHDVSRCPARPDLRAPRPAAPRAGPVAWRGALAGARAAAWLCSRRWRAGGRRTGASLASGGGAQPASAGWSPAAASRRRRCCAPSGRAQPGGRRSRGSGPSVDARRGDLRPACGGAVGSPTTSSRGPARAVTARRRRRLRAPVLVIADRRWPEVQLGATVRATGRLQPADDRGPGRRAGSARATRACWPARASWWRGADAVRAAIRERSPHRPPSRARWCRPWWTATTQAMPEQLVEDFRTSGLTHLLAVSGTNLTLVVGFLLLLARWAGARARAVRRRRARRGRLRAARAHRAERAAGGGDGHGGAGRDGHRRARGAALGRSAPRCCVLLLRRPVAGAVAPGSRCRRWRRRGSCWLAPGWRDALARWLPRWVAEAVAVPLAAQIACTPLVAAISGQVSLVAVAANLLAAPAVGPATVLGLAGGLVGLVWPPLGRLVGCARPPGARVDHRRGRARARPAGGGGRLGHRAGRRSRCSRCCASCVALAGAAAAARPVAGVGAGVRDGGRGAGPLPTPGWPPGGWVMVACDVGQGDGLVLNAGPRERGGGRRRAGPGAMDGCLRRLGVRGAAASCSPTSTPTTSTGWRACSTAARSGAIEVTRWPDPATASGRCGRWRRRRPGCRPRRRTARRGGSAT